MLPILRFLTNYEAFLVASRSFFAVLLLLFEPNPSMRWMFLYYAATSLIVLGCYNRYAHRWRLWYGIVIMDLAVVSSMIYLDGGYASDLYYYYFLTMAMAAFAHRWNTWFKLTFTAAVNVTYLLMMLIVPGAESWRNIAFRMVMFFAVSTVFPMLSFLEHQRQIVEAEGRRASEEKERLEREMESINRQVAEYAFDLHQMAVIDQLTQLHNHNYFHTRVVIEIEKAKQNLKPLSLVLFDIDNFKLVNDTYGHLVGDEVLRTISRRLLELTKDTYFIPCRVGGEELALIVPEADLDMGYEAAESFRKAIEKLRVPIQTGELLNVSVSVGVASFPEHCHNHQQLIDCADHAMYAAKRSGKNLTMRYSVQAECQDVPVG